MTFAKLSMKSKVLIETFAGRVKQVVLERNEIDCTGVKIMNFCWQFLSMKINKKLESP